MANVSDRRREPKGIPTGGRFVKGNVGSDDDLPVAYLTDDGSVFDTPEEADVHTRRMRGRADGYLKGHSVFVVRTDRGDRLAFMPRGSRPSGRVLAEYSPDTLEEYDAIDDLPPFIPAAAVDADDPETARYVASHWPTNADEKAARVAAGMERS